MTSPRSHAFPRRVALPFVLLGALAVPLRAQGQPFTYLPPGDLIEGSGEGRADETVYAPGMRFPIEQAPAYANSQVYMNGGMYGPGGGQCDEVNYSYPWRDNYCEERSWDMPLCPSGVGHQGQDLRPATCENSTYWCVAAVDGTITNIGSYSVYLTAADGTRYDYLHMSDVQVSVGQQVARGTPMGKVSNQFNGTPTTIHLHFNIRQFVEGLGDVYVPPYTSLVSAYQQLVHEPPVGTLDRADCDLITGWALAPDRPDDSIPVQISIDGLPNDLGAVVTERIADGERADVCDGSSPCPHGFSLSSPVRILDGQPHRVHAFALDGSLGPVELAQSPATTSCEALALDGIRRPAAEAALSAWALDPDWDGLIVSGDDLEALPTGLLLDAAPSLVGDESGADLWVYESGVLRSVAGELVAAAWRLDPSDAHVWSDSELAATPLGPPLRPRPVLVSSTGNPGSWYLLDDPALDDLTPEPPPQPEDATAPLGVPNDGDGCGCRLPRREASPPELFLGAIAAAWLALRHRRRRVRRGSIGLTPG